MASNPLVGLVPRIIFWVVAGPSTWEYGVLAALVAAVLLAIPSLERGTPNWILTATAKAA